MKYLVAICRHTVCCICKPTFNGILRPTIGCICSCPQLVQLALSTATDDPDCTAVLLLCRTTNRVTARCSIESSSSSSRKRFVLSCKETLALLGLATATASTSTSVQKRPIIIIIIPGTNVIFTHTFVSTFRQRAVQQMAELLPLLKL